MDPLSIDKELVLVLSLWQVQDRYKVIMALEKGKETILVQYWGFISELYKNENEQIHNNKKRLTFYLVVSSCSSC